jgi:hypothetical protein
MLLFHIPHFCINPLSPVRGTERDLPVCENQVRRSLSVPTDLNQVPQLKSERILGPLFPIKDILSVRRYFCLEK